MPDNSPPLVDYVANEQVATLTLNDPATMNAMSAEMAAQFSAALNLAQQESKAVVITGGGKAFCSGAKISPGGFDPSNSSYDAGAAVESRYNPLIQKMRRLTIPSIIAVNGPAAGFGCSLALAGDIVLASQSASFVQAFVNIGLIPDGGSSHFLVVSAGRARALRMMLSGEKISAERAERWGMITEVVSPDNLLSNSENWARRLADGPTKSLLLIRELAWSATKNSFTEQVQLERELQTIAGRTTDHREGVNAFRSKRPPNFRGC